MGWLTSVSLPWKNDRMSSPEPEAQERWSVSRLIAANPDKVALLFGLLMAAFVAVLGFVIHYAVSDVRELKSTTAEYVSRIQVLEALVEPQERQMREMVCSAHDTNQIHLERQRLLLCQSFGGSIDFETNECLNSKRPIPVWKDHLFDDFVRRMDCPVEH